MTAPASVKAGDNILLSYKNLPAGRTVVIRVYGPDGKEMPGRTVVTGTEKGKEYSFGVPYNAAKGKYKFVVMDHITGLKAEKTVNVK